MPGRTLDVSRWNDSPSMLIEVRIATFRSMGEPAGVNRVTCNGHWYVEFAKSDD